MGSPLGPLFADIFLCFHEKTWIENCLLAFKPSFYRRYVDDCFLLFRSPKRIPLFLNYLIQQHPNINFTFETESNSSLPFPDIQITRHNDCISTSVYHKPSFTGLFTNFHSFIPFSFKKGLILSLLHCFFNICSNYENFHEELETFKKIFWLNGYPTHFFDSCISVFQIKFSSPNLWCIQLPKKIFFCLPFTGIHSPNPQKNLKRFCFSLSSPQHPFHFPPYQTSFSLFLPLRTGFLRV